MGSGGLEGDFALGGDVGGGLGESEGVIEVDVAAVVLDALDHVELHVLLIVLPLVLVLVVEEAGQFHSQK